MQTQAGRFFAEEDLSVPLRWSKNVCSTLIKPHLTKVVVGTKMFSYTATQFLNILRKLLIQLSVDHATAFTLKAFRAGKATALASSGAPLGQILAAGEWRGRAVLNLQASPLPPTLRR